MSINPKFRTVAAGSALALAATSGAMLASPAVAATSDTLSYTCPVLGNPQTLTGTHTVAETVPYGGVVDVTTAVTIPQGLSSFLYNGGFRQVDGTVVNQATATVGPVTVPVESPGTVAKTDINSDAATTIIATGGPSLAPYAAATPAGTVIAVSMLDRAEDSDMDALLYTYNEAGEQSGPVPLACELDDEQNLAVGDVTVVKADTETTAKLAKKRKKMIAKAVVDAPESGVDTAGQVKFVLKRDGKKVGAQKAELNNERAKAVFKGAKKGKYKLIAKYLGGDNFNGSKDVAKKKV